MVGRPDSIGTVQVRKVDRIRLSHSRVPGFSMIEVVTADLEETDGEIELLPPLETRFVRLDVVAASAAPVDSVPIAVNK